MEHLQKFSNNFNQERLEKKAEIERLFAMFNQFKKNEVVDEWVKYSSNYSLRQISDAVEYCFNNLQRMPSFAQFKDCIPNRAIKQGEDKIAIQAQKETAKRKAESKKAYDELIKRGFSDKEVDRYVELYWKNICDMSQLRDNNLEGPFKDKALADLFRANMDGKRALKHGKAK